MELVFFEPQKNQKPQSRVLGIVAFVPFVVQSCFIGKPFFRTGQFDKKYKSRSKLCFKRLFIFNFH
jgi:hypothetical protein